ncbi:hypothetical protein ACNJNU_01545 [Citrobacter freundii]
MPFSEKVSIISLCRWTLMNSSAPCKEVSCTASR